MKKTKSDVTYYLRFAGRMVWRLACVFSLLTLSLTQLLKESSWLMPVLNIAAIVLLFIWLFQVVFTFDMSVPLKSSIAIFSTFIFASMTWIIATSEFYCYVAGVLLLAIIAAIIVAVLVYLLLVIIFASAASRNSLMSDNRVSELVLVKHGVMKPAAIAKEPVIAKGINLKK